MVSEGNLDNQILNTTGEMHSLQDGGTLGVLLGLILTGSPILPIAAAALGLGATKLTRKRLAKQATEVIRVDDVRSSPEYFVVGLVLATVVTGAVSVAFQRIVLAGVV